MKLDADRFSKLGFGRFFLSVIIASLSNLAFLAWWISWFDFYRSIDFKDVLLSLGSLLFFEVYSFLITAIGLWLLILSMRIVERFLPLKRIRLPVFILGGAGLGWSFFPWVPEPALFALFGGFSAATFAAQNRSYFFNLER